MFYIMDTTILHLGCFNSIIPLRMQLTNVKFHKLLALVTKCISFL